MLPGQFVGCIGLGISLRHQQGATAVQASSSRYPETAGRATRGPGLQKRNVPVHDQGRRGTILLPLVQGQGCRGGEIILLTPL